ncbi:hypothetical protein LZV00_11765 [Pseudomonas kielensis]|uniref:hypothetical protein n=1 Tax=Pseudomonas kielensis TaxID=2762577 RepID=UPI0022401770|nr:hypothetical protein [Pseudomonas kielensis]UZM16876.1 hypothetical protein LZV00_11765 [Pseudomonas kielensis]
MLASSAAEERPANPVPMPLTLCSLMAKPEAKTGLHTRAAANVIVVLNTAFLNTVFLYKACAISLISFDELK